MVESSCEFRGRKATTIIVERGNKILETSRAHKLFAGGGRHRHDFHADVIFTNRNGSCRSKLITSTTASGWLRRRRLEDGRKTGLRGHVGRAIGAGVKRWCHVTRKGQCRLISK